MMNKTFVYLILALVFGIAIGMQFNLDEDNSRTANKSPIPVDQESIPSTGMADTNLTSIQQQLRIETEARHKLESEVSLLRDQLNDIEQLLIANNNFEPSVIVEKPDESEAKQNEDEWFKEQALLDIGMDATQVKTLKSFFEQQEMQRLYLRDQSIREAWDRDQRREAFQALADETSAFLEQLDDDDYDAYLYASGQSNRAAVSSVLDNAQAGIAGIKAGDYVLSYDNERIYSGFELRQATSSGTIGDTISVQVERNGEILEFYLERGPLGIRLDSVSVEPQR